MIPVKLNGVTYNFPTTLFDITLGQWLDLRKSTGHIYDLSVLTGLDQSTISSFKSVGDLKHCLTLLQMFADSYDDSISKAKLPSEVKIGAKVIPLPKKLNLEPFGAYMAVYDIISTEHNTYEANGNRFSDDKIIENIIANYLYMPYSGLDVFDDEKVDGLIYRKLIRDMNFMDAYTISMFFFRKYPNL
jgi:hypothetical protein